MPWIAAAIFAGSVHQANQARKEASKAREQAARESTAAAKQAQEQLAAQREQANIARERLSYEIGKGAEDRARLESEAKRAADELEAQQREFAEGEATRMRAARRGGRRSLLSDARLTPELGLGVYENGTLGAGMGV